MFVRIIFTVFPRRFSIRRYECVFVSALEHTDDWRDHARTRHGSLRTILRLIIDDDAVAEFLGAVGTHICVGYVYANFSLFILRASFLSFRFFRCVW